MILIAIKDRDNIKFIDHDENLVQLTINDNELSYTSDDLRYFAESLFHVYKFYKNMPFLTITGIYIFNNTRYDFQIDCSSGNITSESKFLSNAIEGIDRMSILLENNNTPAF